MTAKAWNESIDNDWNEPDNWTPSGVPQAGDAVTISTGTLVTLTTPVATCDSIDCTGFTGTLQEVDYLGITLTGSPTATAVFPSSMTTVETNVIRSANNINLTTGSAHYWTIESASGKTVAVTGSFNGEILNDPAVVTISGDGSFQPFSSMTLSGDTTVDGSLTATGSVFLYGTLDVGADLTGGGDAVLQDLDLTVGDDLLWNTTGYMDGVTGDVTGTAVAKNLAWIQNCDFTAGTHLDATDNCGEGTGNNLGVFFVPEDEENTAPVADAGPDQAITLPTEAVTLAGSADDDGLPEDPGALTYLWECISGPGPVQFVDDTDPETTAHFPSNGTYVLQLTVSDGELSDTDTMNVVVTAAAPAAADSEAWQIQPASEQAHSGESCCGFVWEMGA
jgi:hypothetical protein